MTFDELKVTPIRKDGILEQIEYVGRLCYNSRDKIADGTALKFCENLAKRGHTTPFEHVRVVVPIPGGIEISKDSPYGLLNRLHFCIGKDHKSYDIVNGRDALACGYSVAELAELERANDAITMEIHCDIGLERELLRHRVFSFMEQSTRYCNLANADQGIHFILPQTDKEVKYVSQKTLCEIEKTYLSLIESGVKPQYARYVLPLCTATTLCMTGTKENWTGFLKLRLAEGAHPEMRILAEYIYAKLKIVGMFDGKEI